MSNERFISKSQKHSSGAMPQEPEQHGAGRFLDNQDSVHSVPHTSYEGSAAGVLYNLPQQHNIKQWETHLVVCLHVLYVILKYCLKKFFIIIEFNHVIYNEIYLPTNSFNKFIY